MKSAAELIQQLNYTDECNWIEAERRQLAGKAKPFPEELHYNDEDLLYSLGCIRKEKGEIQLTYAGLLLFGKRIAHPKGKGRATYYVVGKNFIIGDATEDSKPPVDVSAPPQGDSEPVDDLRTPPQIVNTPVDGLKTPPQTINTPVNDLKTPPLQRGSAEVDDIISQIAQLGSRVNDIERVREIILELCAIQPFKATEIARLFNRQEDYFKR